MLSYYKGGYNDYMIRTAQLPSGSKFLLLSYQDMITLENSSVLFDTYQWSYNECESFVSFSVNFDINTDYPVGTEFRLTLTPAVSTSAIPFTYMDDVWNGSIQFYASQSIDKPVYKTQNDEFISYASDNEFIIVEPFNPTPTTTTTTIAPSTTTTTTLAPTTTTTTTIAPTTTTTTLAPTCFYTVGELVEGGVVAFASPSGAVILGLENIGSGILGCEGYDYGANGYPIDADTIGQGWYNTQKILLACTASTAATLASNYTGSGYTDWCLGNRGEWQQIYNNRVVLNAAGANLGTIQYWQGVPIGPFPGIENNRGLVANMNDGNMTDIKPRNSTFTIRPIRYACDLTPTTTTTSTTTAAP